MSITITIRRNFDFCVEHDTIRTRIESCYSCSYDGQLNPACLECEGTGQVEIRELPFELNIANSNFCTLWNALGLDSEPCGEIPAGDLLLALESLEHELLVRSETDQRGDGRCRVIDCGITPERAQRYIQALGSIAREADNRIEPIVWY